MPMVAGIVGLAVIAVLLLDVFKAVVLARRAQGEFRLSRMFYRAAWPVFAAIARRTESGRRREDFLGIFGPLSLLLLFFFWAAGLIMGFALVLYALYPWNGDLQHFSNDLYQSAASFLTIGGESPRGFIRWITVVETGIGFSFLALVIGYLPVFYQSFARRELHISLLDARAGSPPCAAEILVREGKFARQLERQLAAWEEWAADLLQDELSYPMLAYFRSQHPNQSWVGALVAITDTSALISLSAQSELQHQAEATFAMGRHALIDITRVLGIQPVRLSSKRLAASDLGTIRDGIRSSSTCLDPSLLCYERVSGLMRLYESYSAALSSHLLMALPLWISEKEPQDNWRMAAQGQNADIFTVSDPFQGDQEKSA
jgi:hypothetical protein